MASPSVTSKDKIILNFAWRGPNIGEGGFSRGGVEIRCVDLVFKGAKMDISVRLPEKIDPSAIQKLPFACRKYDATETRPDSLSVTIEKIYNLTVKAGLFQKGRSIGPKIMDSSGRVAQQETAVRRDLKVPLKIPDELEAGQTYSLLVSSQDLSLSARLVKGVEIAPHSKEEEKGWRDRFAGRMKNMGDALIQEGIQNLNLASRELLRPSSQADLFAHAMKGVIRAGQKMNPEIRVPDSKPSESFSDLDQLSKDELQSRFERAYEEDKKFEIERMRAAIKGESSEFNKILQAEHANSQLLLNLKEALERKGVKPKTPQSERVASLIRECKALHAEAIKRAEETCKMQ